ncbi:hypothetical protein F4780DRAFT_542449 [Xylariomycetidae sp. FL0641]|nr:hypothetical protein F4780DRAFT_542449 [Xylariomycetidae sp. FL0641]
MPSIYLNRGRRITPAIRPRKARAWPNTTPKLGSSLHDVIALHHEQPFPGPERSKTEDATVVNRGAVHIASASREDGTTARSEGEGTSVDHFDEDHPKSTSRRLLLRPWSACGLVPLCLDSLSSPRDRLRPSFLGDGYNILVRHPSSCVQLPLERGITLEIFLNLLRNHMIEVLPGVSQAESYSRLSSAHANKCTRISWATNSQHQGENCQ